MVLRRCRHIVVSDAGCDPKYSFEDLANAIRKIRIDFGIDIEFPGGLRIVSPKGPPTCAGRWAVGRIKYSDVDPETRDGVLLYLKPAITGDEPIDVATYAHQHSAFPHESTANQWFDEGQLESYRMLGLHTVTTLTAGRRCATVADLCLAAESHALAATR
jgi:hypothetical protein